MAKFDWYECTFFGADPLEIIRRIERFYPFSLIEPDVPKYGYRVGQVFRHGGEPIARVWWGGNEGVHVSSTSSNAHDIAPLLREHGVHSVTRLDACEDWIQAGLFDRLASHLTGFAVANGITIIQLGDWVRGEARTLYLGSKQSAVRLILYEKGYEQCGDRNWVRLEVRVRPKGRTAREAVAKWTPSQAFGASRWVVAALEGLGWDHLQAQSVGTVYRPSNDERARITLRKQYGAVIARWFDECGRDPSAFVGELLVVV